MYLSVIAGCAISFLLCVALIPVSRRVAIRLGNMDRPDGVRKMHAEDVPNSGGAAVAVSVGLTILLSWLFIDYLPGWITLPSRFFWLGAIIIVLAGLIDDNRGISAWNKLGIQVTCSILAWSMGYRITLDIELLSVLPESVMLLISAVLTVGWITLVINALNLIDGLDGLAAGISVIAIAFLAFMSPNTTQITGLLLFLYVGSALLGFLVYNRYPASVFLGDTGSMFIGYILAVTALATLNAEHNLPKLIPAGLVLGLPLLDVSVTIFRRIRKRKTIFWSDNDHIHHRLTSRFSHPKAVHILYVVAFGFGISGWIWKEYVLFRIPLAVILLLTIAASIHWLGYTQSTESA